MYIEPLSDYLFELLITVHLHGCRGFYDGTDCVYIRFLNVWSIVFSIANCSVSTE